MTRFSLSIGLVAMALHLLPTIAPLHAQDGALTDAEVKEIFSTGVVAVGDSCNRNGCFHDTFRFLAPRGDTLRGSLAAKAERKPAGGVFHANGSWWVDGSRVCVDFPAHRNQQGWADWCRPVNKSGEDITLPLDSGGTWATLTPMGEDGPDAE